jgi:hypothetical protein
MQMRVIAPSTRDGSKEFFGRWAVSVEVSDDSGEARVKDRDLVRMREVMQTISA